MEKKVRSLSKKAVSILLCILMVFSSVNLTVFADNQNSSGQEVPGYDAEAWAELMDEGGAPDSNDFLNDPSGTQVYVEPTTGITWVYTVSGGEATITKSYIGTQTNKVYGKVTVPSSLGGYTVTGLYRCFESSNITSVILPSGVKNLTSAFKGCTELKYIHLPSGLTYIGNNTFDGCTGLPSIYIPETVTYIGDYALCGMDSIKSIVLPDSVRYIGEGAVSRNSNMTSLRLPKSIVFEGKGCDIKTYAFSENPRLQAVLWPRDFVYIPACSFFNDRALSSVGIPNTLLGIDGGAFENVQWVCLYYEGSETDWGRLKQRISAKISGKHLSDQDLSNFDSRFNSSEYSIAVYGKESKELLNNVQAYVISNYSSDRKTYSSESGYVDFTLEATDKNSNITIKISSQDMDNTTQQMYASVNINSGSLKANTVNSVYLPFVNVEALAPDLSSMNGDTVESGGPAVKIPGLNFTSFLTSNGLNFGPVKAKVSVDTEKKRYKITLSTNQNFGGTKDDDKSKAYDEAKKLIDEAKNLTTFQKERFKTLFDEKQNATVGFQASGSLVGYCEFGFPDERHSEPYLTSGGAVVSFETALDKTWRPAGALGLVFVHFNITLGVDGSLKLERDDSAPSSVAYTLSIKPHGQITLGAGIGWMSFLGLEGGGSFGADVTITCSNKVDPKQEIDPLKITLNGYFYAKYKVFFWSGEYQWPDGDESVWQVYPKKVANLNSSGGEEMSDVISDYSNYSLDSRDYLDGASDDFVSLNSGDTEAYEMKNVYPQAEPKMVRLSDGRILCVWTGDNGDKNNKTNYTRIMYAIRSTDGIWTYGGEMDPTDDKAEFAPNVVVSGDKCYIFWKRACEKVSDDITLSEMVGKMDLYMSIYDGSGFSAPVMVSGGTHYLPLFYIASTNGTDVTFAWGENDANSQYQKAGKNQLYVRKVTNGVLGNILTYSKDAGYLNSIVMGQNGSDLYVSKDSDDNRDTSDDNAIYRISSTGEVSALTDGYSNDSDIRMIDGVIYWNRSGSLYELNYYNGPFNTGASCGAQYDVVGNGDGSVTVFFIQGSGLTSELYMTKGRTWNFTTPVAQTAFGDYLSSFDAETDTSGNIIIAPCKADVNEDAVTALSQGSDILNLGSSEVYGNSDILFTGITPRYDLSVDSTLYYDPDSIENDKDADLTVTVLNNSTEPVDREKITLTDASGNAAGEYITNVPLAVGETKDITFTHHMPGNLDGYKINAKVTIPDKTENDDTDNVASSVLGYPDLTLTDVKAEAFPNDNGQVSAVLGNTGTCNADNVKVELHLDTADGELIGTEDIGLASPGSLSQVVIDDPAMLSRVTQEQGWVRYCLVIKSDDTESDYGDNTETAIYEAPDPEFVMMNLSGKTIASGSTLKLEAKAIPASAHAIVRWQSMNPEVATVDDSGNVTAVSEGEAEIMAMAGMKTASCKVTVSETEPDVTWVRYCGDSRYATASAIARAAFPNGAKKAVLVSGTSLADALTASGYAGANKLPILITDGNALSEETMELLNDLGVEQVLIVGGTSAVSQDVEDTLTNTLAISKDSIDRVYGDDRYLTAEALYEYGVKDGSFKSKDSCIIASGAAFADAISASPWSYRNGWPVFLAGDSGTMSDKSLAAASAFANKYVIGGNVRITSETLAALGKGAMRLSGDDRYGTSASVASYFLKTTDGADYGNIAYASGNDGHLVDSLTGCMLQGSRNSAIILADNSENEGIYLTGSEVRGKGAANFTILGGKACITDETQDAIANELG